MAEPLFERKIVPIMRDMLRDLTAALGPVVDVPDVAAAGGNLGVETGEFTLRLEKGKTSYETTGFGWAQWTGDRRRLFDEWMRANGFKDVADNPARSAESRYDAACYGFMIHEMTRTWEKRVWTTGGEAYYPGTKDKQHWLPVKGYKTIDEKTLAFCALYERPGVPHMDRRKALARRALAAYQAAEGEPAVIADVSKPVERVVTVNPEWMPRADMDRVVVHWSAGTNKASSEDKKHYHIIVEGDGRLVRGDKSIKDNESSADGVYAAHTRNCNTKSIGISMAGMYGARESPFDPGPYPIKVAQWNAMVDAVADLCRTYGIAVTSKTVLTHAEVQPNLGIEQTGKWDVTRLPWDSKTVGYKACGDKLRREVQAAMQGVRATTPPPETKPPVAEGAGGVAGGIIAGLIAWLNGVDWSVIVPVGLIVGGIAAVLIFAARRKSS